MYLNTTRALLFQDWACAVGQAATSLNSNRDTQRFAALVGMLKILEN